MRFIPSEKVRKLRKEVEPYLISEFDNLKFKEGTPEEIKEKYQLWSKLYDEEREKAEEICY